MSTALKMLAGLESEEDKCGENAKLAAHHHQLPPMYVRMYV